MNEEKEGHLEDESVERKDKKEERVEKEDDKDREEEASTVLVDDERKEGLKSNQVGGESREKTTGVEIPPPLKKLLLLEGALLDELKVHAGTNNIRKLKAEIADFAVKVLLAAEQLPDSPGRSRVSEGWISRARAEFIRVDASWANMRRLLGVYAKILVASGLPAYQSASSWSLMKAHLIDDGSIVETEGYLRYLRLRSWLYRRTPAGRKKAREYEAKPEVRALRKRNRPSKEAEAKRQREAYRRRKERACELAILVEAV
jgi:hypothetical protein